jgi:acyl carrier protein
MIDSDIRQEVISIVTSIKSKRSESTLITEDTDLIVDLGFDSIGILNLIIEIEVRCKVDLKIEEIVMEDLRSINLICQLIQRHRVH